MFDLAWILNWPRQNDQIIEARNNEASKRFRYGCIENGKGTHVFPDDSQENGAEHCAQAKSKASS